MEKELKNEIASTRDGRDITRGFVDKLPLLPPTDRLLQLKGGGDLLVYQEVLRDEQVKACFEQRVRAVISRPWEVRPGGDKRVDKQAATFIEEQLKAIRFDNITEKMLYGVFYGYAVAEALWKVDGSRIVLDTERGGIKVRDRRRFGFGPDMQLKLKTMANPLGEDLPDRKFWIFATGADHDDEPYGIGLAHWLYWPVFFKRSGVKFWLVFLEKFGSPTAKGTYPSGTTEAEQNQLLAALQAIQTDSAIIFPEGMTAELLEAKRGGTADYTSLYDRMDAAIARATLGQTASTQGTPGRLGNDDLQADVRLDIVRADADLVCMSFNATIVRWLVEWNFPGAALPQVWRTIEEPEDLDQRAERDGKISGMGFKPSLKYIQETYGGEWTEKAEPNPVIPGEVQPQPGIQSGADFAEGDSPFPDQQAIDDLIAGLPSAALQAQMEQILKPVLDLIEKGESYEDVLGRLAEAYPNMSTDQLEQWLTRGWYAAAAWGVISATGTGQDFAELTQSQEATRQQLASVHQKLDALSLREPQPISPTIHVHMPEGMVQVPEIRVPDVKVDVHVPQGPAPFVTVAPPEVKVDVAAPSVTLEATLPTPEITVKLPPRKTTSTVERNQSGEIVRTTQIETDI